MGLSFFVLPSRTPVAVGNKPLREPLRLAISRTMMYSTVWLMDLTNMNGNGSRPL